jgi:3-deoxy-D-manno-octulosonate 8-phosphate phosphatase (KDO 8-P phosphatase)
MPIKLAVFDFDGVFTNGVNIVSESGEVSKGYNVKDGYALQLLHDKGVKYGIISGDTSGCIEQIKAVMCNISFLEKGCHDKLVMLAKWREHYKLDWSEISYMGDDLIDLPCIGVVGFSAAPSDAVKAVKSSVKLVTERKGGDGAVREMVDHMIESGQL